MEKARVGVKQNWGVLANTHKVVSHPQCWRGKDTKFRLGSHLLYR